MKIKKIHIISFGGLKNYTLSFEDGFNCVYGENEQGKTTVMSFIKMMFYGSDRGSTQISKNIRKKYTPWDGSSMAGSIEFENKGKLFKLEREFRSSNSTDKVTLTDLSIGEKQTVEADIGAKLFGLSAAAFERSIFIGQLGFPDSDTSAESELNARLSNIASTGDEKVSLEEVTKRLEKARFAIISKTSKAGEYYKNSIIANDLKEKLNASITANKQYNEGKEKLLEYNNQTDLLIEKSKELKVQISKEQDIKNAQKLRELLDTKVTLEHVKKELTLKDGTPADENFLRNLKFAASKLENAKAKTQAKARETEIVENQLNTLLSGPKLSCDETPEALNDEVQILDKNLRAVKAQITETETKITELTAKRDNGSFAKARFNIPLLIIGIVLLILCLIALIISPVITVVLGFLGFVFTALSFAIKPKSNKKLMLIDEEITALKDLLNSKTAHAEDIVSQITARRTQLEAIRLAATANNEVIEKQRQQLQNSQIELAELRTQEQKLENELSQLTESIGADENALVSLENAVARQKELKQHINFLLRDLNNISYEDAKLKLQAIENNDEVISADFEEIKTEYDRLIKIITERTAKASSIDTELKALVSGVENPEILRAKLTEINTLLNSQRAFCDSVDIAMETLAESFATLRSSFGSELEKKSAEIFSQLTKGKYSNMVISKSFGINVEETLNPISREAEYLSSGTFDQAYLSMRLAVASLLDTKLPLFLDDTLTQYDDTRANATLAFLKDHSKDGQAIMFTCHKSVFEGAKDLGCKTQTL